MEKKYKSYSGPQFAVSMFIRIALFIVGDILWINIFHNYGGDHHSLAVTMTINLFTGSFIALAAILVGGMSESRRNGWAIILIGIPVATLIVNGLYSASSVKTTATTPTAAATHHFMSLGLFLVIWFAGVVISFPFEYRYHKISSFATDPTGGSEISVLVMITAVTAAFWPIFLPSTIGIAFKKKQELTV